MRNIEWDCDAWDDYIYWQSIDKKVVKKINQLIKDIARHPYTGIGKPEPLKGNLSGMWSRRITDEHRIVYAVEDEKIVIFECRLHYK